MEGLAGLDLHAAHRRAAHGGFDEEGKRLAVDEGPDVIKAAGGEGVAADGGPGHHREAGSGEDLLGQHLVHGDGAGGGGAADIGQVEDLEEALQRAVFAEGAMHNGKDAVDVGVGQVMEVLARAPLDDARCLGGEHGGAVGGGDESAALVGVEVDDVVARGGEPLADRPGGAKRDQVLDAATTKDNANTHRTPRFGAATTVAGWAAAGLH